MQSDLGKLFIGGISWDTNEKCLKDYFSKYGEIVEAIIMKDRTTGRARGFGFVVFADPAVAERVIEEKHNIDGRIVEAKKAVPRDDLNVLSRSSGSLPGSPSPGQSRKIFVGGLASTVTEADFKKYFEQFGTVNDVVVMYDHNTQRPRGFGFITYDSEEAADRVLLKTFHELNGKMVEVKRAVPKEISFSPSRTPFVGYNYGFRANNLLNGYIDGYTPSQIGMFGLNMDTRFSPFRNGLPPYDGGYRMGMNFESAFNNTYVGSPDFNANLGVSPCSFGSSGRSGSVGRYDGNNKGDPSLFSLSTQKLWANVDPVCGMISENFRDGIIDTTGDGINWGTSLVTSQGMLNMSEHSGNTSSRSSGSMYNFGNHGSIIPLSSSSSHAVDSHGSTIRDLYINGPVYGDSTWQTNRRVSFGLDTGKPTSKLSGMSHSGYMGDYGISGHESSRVESMGFI